MGRPCDAPFDISRMFFDVLLIFLTFNTVTVGEIERENIKVSHRDIFKDRDRYELEWTGIRTMYYNEDRQMYISFFLIIISDNNHSTIAKSCT